MTGCRPFPSTLCGRSPVARNDRPRRRRRLHRPDGTAGLRDDGAVHRATQLLLEARSGGRFVYENADFFPLDGRGFGNEGNPHNFHFTTEIHGSFVYRGGEVFTFRGDDDVFVFVNGRLALDLGGVHGVEGGTITFDQQAQALGLTRGMRSPLDVFHAERRTVASNFRIETTIECLTPIEIQ